MPRADLQGRLHEDSSVGAHRLRNREHALATQSGIAATVSDSRMATSAAGKGKALEASDFRTCPVTGRRIHRDAERLICRSEMPTGSHIPTTKCRTYGDIQRAETDSHNYMERFQQRAQPNGNALVPGTLGH